MDAPRCNARIDIHTHLRAPGPEPDEQELATALRLARRHGIGRLVLLFNLSADQSETTNLAESRPEMVNTLQSAFDVWIAEMADPLSGAAKLPGAEPAKEGLTEREKERERIRAERKAQRAAGKQKNN